VLLDAATKGNTPGFLVQYPVPKTNDAKLVENQFKNTICTGLRNGLIRVELQGYAYGDDQELIDRLNEITHRHAETEGKFGAIKRAEVKSAEVESHTVLEEIKALRLEVQDLKKQSNAAHNSPNGGNHSTADSNGPNTSNHRAKKSRWMCENCRKTNAEKCNHRFLCGGSGHRKFECPSAAKQLGNE
jgi:hypothetical protein